MKRDPQKKTGFPGWGDILETEKAACETGSQTADEDIVEKDQNNKWYFRQIRKIPVLSAEEEKKLFLRFAEGDEQAGEKLILSNLRLAAYMARRYANGNEWIIDDLVQEGNLGLMTAVRRFDATQGYRFSTYAVQWIRKKIAEEVIRQQRCVTLPVTLLQLIRKVENAETELEMLYGRKPVEEQIAYHLKVPVEKVTEARIWMAKEEQPLEVIPGEKVEDDGG